MKTNLKLIAMLFATLLMGLTACDKKQDAPNALTGENAYVTLALRLPSVSTRAGVADKHQGDLYGGTADESKVSKVLVGFYKGDVCATRALLDASNATGTFTGNDVAATGSNQTKLVTKAVKVPAIGTTDSYDVVVFFNPTSEVESKIQVGLTKAELEKASNYDEAKIVTADGIMMSNAKGYVNVEQNKLYNTAEEAEAAAANKINITVERAVAKVFVNNTMNSTVGQGQIKDAKLELLGWKLDVTNKLLFNMRQMDKVLVKPYSTVATTATTLAAETADSERIDSYAKDPNFDKAGGQYYPDDFNYLNVATGATTTPTVNPTGFTSADLWAPGYNDADGKYVAENTMLAPSQYRDITTLALFAIKVTPKVLEGTTETNYIVYGGSAYTIDKIKEYLALVPNDPHGELQHMPASFVADVKKFSADGSTDGSNELKAKIEAAVAAKAPFNEHGFALYIDLINYYEMPIRHFTNEQQMKTMEYGRYGLVRNNIYKLTVNSVKQFGSPIVPEPGHEPDDPNVMYISLSVELLPWLVRESDYDL